MTPPLRLRSCTARTTIVSTPITASTTINQPHHSMSCLPAIAPIGAITAYSVVPFLGLRSQWSP